MIEHFNAHKHEFEELVRIYGEFSSFGSGPVDFSKHPDVSELKLKSGVGHITGGSGGIWLDEPYSLESARELKKLENLEVNSRRMVLIKMKGDKYSSFYFFDGGLNWKDYVYIPIDPEIFQGKLRLPRGISDAGKPRFFSRVLDSLDSPKWDESGCILRKIEPKWFLRRCRAR